MRYLAAFLLLIAAAQAQPAFRLRSPGGTVSLLVEQDAAGTVRYSLAYRGQPAIRPSALGFRLSKPQVHLDRFDLAGADSSQYDETWTPVWGEVQQIRNHYNELTVRLKDRSAYGIEIRVVFRLFDDGAGFRYEFPEQPGLRHFIVAEELTEFAMSGDHKAFWIPGDYDSNEYLYNITPLSQIEALEAAARERDIAVTAPIGPSAVQTPLTMKSASGLYLTLHEAALINYPAMNLVLDKADLRFRAHLVPDAVGHAAYLQTPARTPWRTLTAGSQAADLLASKLILNLNEPSAIGPADWARPQKFVGMWWEMHIGKADWQLAGGKHGANTANVMRYIDFAAEHGFDGVLVEGWNTGWEDWFGNWKEEVFDFVTPYPDYDIDSLAAYARRKGVRLIMHHETSGSVTNYERRIDTACRYMQRYGMNTVKTGYVGRIIPRGEHHDGQWMVNHYVRTAAKMAEYQIMLDAHEPVRPTGLHRTYPNWMASEAARGSEFHNAPTLGMSPEHTTILPFTRMMGGPMDFTPGFFHLRLNQFDSTRTTRVRTTLAKQLALYVTMYSPLQMVPDLPENYRRYPDAFQFIVEVPVDWADTRILEAEPGDYISIARQEKGGRNWYIGAITDENSRTAVLNLDFLPEGARCEAVIYRDAPDAHWDTRPEAYMIERRRVSRKTRLEIPLAAGGGCAVQLRVE
ncbi:MAG: glycoside hydrolase family 97 protein [Bacteroidia bacterium]|nr:glycoside hydrolase family 97 protein [Bacteroidia bacterium]